MPTPLTIVIPALNEGSQIAACVRHLAWASQVIVADGGSTDDTPRLAREAGAHVLVVPNVTIAAQRNAAIAAARTDWIFALDADERIDAALAEELGRVVAAPAHEAYAVSRRNYYLGRLMRRGGWGDNWAVRLFRKNRRFVERRVHEGLEPVPDTGRLGGALEHVPYRDLGHHLEKINLYARWGAQDLYDRGRRARIADLLVRPPFTFVKAYVVQLGMLEGWHGAVLCGLAAVSVFLKYARLWELERRSHG
ncbi:MAG TPA: glycosyltransferase family 2 protein [Gemmatimonadales bacterium]